MLNVLVLQCLFSFQFFYYSILRNHSLKLGFFRGLIAQLAFPIFLMKISRPFAPTIVLQIKIRVGIFFFVTRGLGCLMVVQSSQ